MSLTVARDSSSTATDNYKMSDFIRKVPGSNPVVIYVYFQNVYMYIYLYQITSISRLKNILEDSLERINNFFQYPGSRDFSTRFLEKFSLKFLN